MGNVETSTNLSHKIAPCGLLCEKCFASLDGNIRQAAAELLHQLGNFGPYASRFSELLNNKIFELYPQFHQFLNFLANGSCSGCRLQACHLFAACKVRTCYKEQNVEYCFQCSLFPCQQTGFDSHLHQRWININHRIRNEGLEAYYQSVKELARYQ